MFPQDDQSRNTSPYRLPELEYRDGLRDDAAMPAAKYTNTVRIGYARTST